MAVMFINDEQRFVGEADAGQYVSRDFRLQLHAI